MSIVHLTYCRLSVIIGHLKLKENDMNARDLLNLLDCEDYIDLTVKQFVDMLKEIEAEKLVEDEKFSDDVMTAQDIRNEGRIIQHSNGETEFVFDEDEDEELYEDSSQADSDYEAYKEERRGI